MSCVGCILRKKGLPLGTAVHICGSSSSATVAAPAVTVSVPVVAGPTTSVGAAGVCATSVNPAITTVTNPTITAPSPAPSCSDSASAYNQSDIEDDLTEEELHLVNPGRKIGDIDSMVTHLVLTVAKQEETISDLHCKIDYLTKCLLSFMEQDRCKIPEPPKVPASAASTRMHKPRIVWKKGKCTDKTVVNEPGFTCSEDIRDVTGQTINGREFSYCQCRNHYEAFGRKKAAANSKK